MLWFLPGLTFLLAGCAHLDSPAAGGIGGSFAVQQAVAPVVPFQSVQTKGNVRVTLLKVQRGTTFMAGDTNIIRGSKPDRTYPVPVLDVAYQVEALGNEPIKIWNVQTEEVTIGNRPVTADFLPGNINGGSVGSSTPKGKRGITHEIQIRTAGIQPGELTLTFNTGFNENNEKFVFTNVPLN